MTPDNTPRPSPHAPQAPPRLRRVLGLGDLVFYGLVLIQPVGAVGIFGLADQKSSGHVTLTLLIALAAMMLTAWSYGRMAGLYPPPVPPTPMSGADCIRTAASSPVGACSSITSSSPSSA